MSEVLSIIDASNDVPADARIAIGARGEFLAAEFLKNAGYRIVLSNFKVPVGRNSRGVQVYG